jgi:hypothetical protein
MAATLLYGQLLFTVPQLWSEFYFKSLGENKTAIRKGRKIGLKIFVYSISCEDRLAPLPTNVFRAWGIVLYPGFVDLL